LTAHRRLYLVIKRTFACQSRPGHSGVKKKLCFFILNRGPVDCRSFHDDTLVIVFIQHRMRYTRKSVITGIPGKVWSWPLSIEFTDAGI